MINELIKRREDIKNELGSIRSEVIFLDKKSDRYKTLVSKQIALENELGVIRNKCREINKEQEENGQQEVKRIKKVVPVYVDDYTGVRCEYCGGKMNGDKCSNESIDWPHPQAMYLLPNVQ